MVEGGRRRGKWQRSASAMRAPRAPMATVAASISSNAPAPRTSPLHTTSSGAVRPRAKARSADVASAMCAERSSTRHAALVGRSAMRRVSFSTPIVPASRADGSANGGARETAMSQGKARRRNRSAEPPPTANIAASPGALCSTACATVPLYPNDDTPPTSPASSPRPIAARPVGSAHAAPPRSASPTRRLSRRSCAFGAASPHASPAASTSSPAIAAADSAQRRLRLATRLQQGRLHRARLDRVAQRRARAVRLQPRHARRGHAGLGQRHLQQRALRRAVGRRQARAPPVLPHRAAAERHRAPGHNPRRRLQHRRAARLAAHVAVRAGVEGVAPLCRRRHARHRERQADGGGEHEVDRREQRALALVQLHRSPRGVARRKRRRAGGIIRAAWPLQPQHVRQPARRDGVAAARCNIHATARRARLEHVGKVVAANAEEHARRAAHELGSPQPGRVERLVPPFEQQPLLWIHSARLRRRHAEAPVVEPLGAKHKRAVTRPQRHRLAASLGGRRRLPPRGRHLADQVVPARGHAPHRRHAVGALRQQRARADEHDLGREERPCSGDERRGGSRGGGGVLRLEEGGELPR
eukprot:scaffold32505_cov68-Phaeocystis_antarctica.AAC.4